MPNIELTSQQRRDLRAAAHPLHPVVLIGDRGLTASVLEEIDRSLTAHELIKVHVTGAERDAREAMLLSICEALSCAAVHHLGKTLIIYRPSADAQAAADDPNATRAHRRKSEPYVPKKLAAHGHDAKPRARRKAARGAKVEPANVLQRGASSHTRQESHTPGAAAPRRAGAKPARTAKTVSVHGIPRRSSGSALTLRAGRRGRTSRS